MIETSDLKPLQRQCLLACISDAQRTLTRTCGGFAASTNLTGAKFTVRTVNGLETLGLLRRASPFATEAGLTAPGLRLAEELAEAEAPKAGAA